MKHRNDKTQQMLNVPHSLTSCLVIRMCTWRYPTCMMTMATSHTAPFAVAAEWFCSAATLTAAGQTRK